MDKFDRLRAFISGELDLPSDELSPRTRLGELFPDSLGFVELAMAFEEEGLEFSRDLPDAFGASWQDMSLWELAGYLA